MLPGTPTSALVSAWMNAALRGDVTATDAANACEHVSGQLEVSKRRWRDLVAEATYARAALPVPGDPFGVPIAGVEQAVALAQNLLLAKDSEWVVITEPHHVAPIDATWARTHLLTVAAHAQSVLDGLATTGDRTGIDHAVWQSGATWPPGMSPRARSDAELATRLLIVSTAAREHADVPSSRSQAALMARCLSDVAAASRLLLCAATST